MGKDITTADKDTEEREKVKALSKLLGVDQQREEIDQLNKSMNYLAGKMGEIAKLLDAQSKVLNTLNPANIQAPNQPSKLEDFANLAEKFSPLIEKFFPQNSAPALIDNKIIQEKMVKGFFDNLDTGESINEFIKSSLKKSVTKQVINTSLKDIGKSTVEHGPA